MATSRHRDEKGITELLRQAVNKAIQEIVEEEIENAKRQLEEKLREKVASIAISLSRCAEISTMQDRIVVEFKALP